MSNPTKAEMVSKACEPAVNALLLAQVRAEVIRAKVDAIAKELLDASPYYEADDEDDTKRSGTRITEHKYAWRMTTEDFGQFHAAMNRIERDNGIKPAYMLDEHCPALVAEDLLRKTRDTMIDVAWPLVSPDGSEDGKERLYYSLDTLKKFEDLMIKLVVSRPGYKNPLTGKTVTP